MQLQKRVLGVGVIALGLGLVAWRNWPAPAFVPSIRLPEGLSLAEALDIGNGDSPKGWSTNAYCQGSSGMSFAEDFSGLVNRLRYAIHETSGRTLCRIPNPARCDYLTPRLGECYQISGEKYLIAREFGWEVDPAREQWSAVTFLAFVWGGTNQPRHARDVVAVTEDGILKDGLFGMRLHWSLPQQSGAMSIEYLPTNRCAVVRDVKGLVKIVPIESLKAYAEEGLVTLPPRGQ